MRRAILEGNVQPLQREILEPYRLKLPLLHRHIVDVSKFVMLAGIYGECPHRTDSTVAYELR